MKKFYFIAAMLAMATVANAQVLEDSRKTIGPLYDADFYVTPQQFTFDNKLYLHFEEDLENNEQREGSVFNIYNDDLEKVRSFEVTGFLHQYRNVRERRKNKPSYDEAKETTMEWWGCKDYESGLYRAFTTWEEAKDFVLNSETDLEREIKWNWEENHDFGDAIWIKDNTYMFYDENDPYMKSYNLPFRYMKWNPEDGRIYYSYMQYTNLKNRYAGEWEIDESYSGYTYTKGELEDIYFQNFDENTTATDGNDFILTQTLFNDDANYEYIRAEYDDNAVAYSNEYDRDGDGEIDERYAEYGGICTGFSIVQEDGTVLQTIPAQHPSKNGSMGVSSVIQLNGKLYLIVYECWREDASSFSITEALSFYRIDKETNSVKRVEGNFGMKVRPSVADRNEQVTVELDGDASEIQVLNAAGQTVKRIPVSEGQRQVNFNTHGMNSGVNFVHAKGSNVQSSRKFIVK